MDPHHFDVDPDPTYHPDADPDSDFYLMRIRNFFYVNADPTFHPDADPDSSFQINAQTHEKVLKYAHIPYIFAWHLKLMRMLIRFRIQPITLMRMRIRMRVQGTKMMRIHADPDTQH